MTPLERKRNVYRDLIGKPEATDHFEDLGINESIILKRILKN